MSRSTRHFAPAPPAAIHPPLRLRVSSDPANLAPARRACEQFCVEQGLDMTAAHEVGLCVNEAMANITRHAYGGTTDRPVEVQGEKTVDGVRITLRDWGCGTNPGCLPQGEYTPDAPGGLGLYCLRRLVDEATYTPQPDGMLLTLVKRTK